MPRKPIDYSKTIIYKIVCRDLGITNCYVGQTTDFANRKHGHKCFCKTSSFYVYQFIREHGGWENWDMIMVEQYPCTNLVEAGARERYWIEQLNADLNQFQPPSGLSKSEYQKQYQIKNTEQIAEYMKQYNIDNRDKILEQKKLYYAQKTITQH